MIILQHFSQQLMVKKLHFDLMTFLQTQQTGSTFPQFLKNINFLHRKEQHEVTRNEELPLILQFLEEQRNSLACFCCSCQGNLTCNLQIRPAQPNLRFHCKQQFTMPQASTKPDLNVASFFGADTMCGA